MPRTESQQQEKVLALLGGKIKSLGRKEMSHHCPQLGVGPGRVARPQELGTMAGSERNVGPGQPPTPPAPRTREGNLGGTGTRLWEAPRSGTRTPAGWAGPGRARQRPVQDARITFPTSTELPKTLASNSRGTRAVKTQAVLLQPWIYFPEGVCSLHKRC